MSLQIRNITAGYSQKSVLHDISVEFEAGQFCALIGPNGSGKSTLLKVIAGVMPPNSGQITGFLPSIPRAQNIAYLAQNRIAHPQMQVKDIVALGRAPYKKPFRGYDKDDLAAIKSAMSRADIASLKDRAFGTLSGGQQARVLLARALAVDAPILLVDEPVAALDPYYQLSILSCLKEESKRGKLVIAALHDLSLVRQFTDAICVLDEGNIRGFGTVEQTLTPDILKRVFRIKEINGQREAV